MAISDLRSARTGFNDVADLFESAFDQTLLYGATSGGSGGAYTITVDPVPTSYVAGMGIAFITNHTNAGAATINVNSLGAKNLEDEFSVAFTNDELESGQLIYATYDGTVFRTKGIYAEQTWTPTYGAGGSMTFTSVTTTTATYWDMANQLTYFIVDAAGTTGGTASNTITFTLPSNNTSGGIITYAGHVADGGNAISGFALTSDSTSVTSVRKYDSSNWTLGASRTIRFEGFYKR